MSLDRIKKSIRQKTSLLLNRLRECSAPFTLVSWRGRMNFGDLLSPYIVQQLSGRIPSIEFGKRDPLALSQRLLALGSMLETCATDGDIVWGTGARGQEMNLDCRQLDVRAVRGPLTREVLLNQNIPCPQIYGDPAILMPFLYQPCAEKKYTAGIIPHYSDTTLYMENAPAGTLLINVLQDPLDVIEQICSCEVVLSSSLHGIIIAEAYGIPACWLWPKALEDRGWKEPVLKYRDYYLSTEREPQAYEHSGTVDLEKAVQMARDFAKPEFDSEKLLLSFPFLRRGIKNLQDLKRFRIKKHSWNS